MGFREIVGEADLDTVSENPVVGVNEKFSLSKGYNIPLRLAVGATWAMVRSQSFIVWGPQKGLGRSMDRWGNADADRCLGWGLVPTARRYECWVSR